MSRLHYAILACLALLLTACAGGPSGAGTGRAPHPNLGHKPGPMGFQRVVIDAGHGGHDAGAVSRSTRQREKDLALDTAKRLRTELSRKGFSVGMIRSGDNFVDLDQRVAMANRMGEVLVSIHYNAGGSSLHGPEVYYWRVDSHGLAVRLQGAMNAVYGGRGNARGLVRRRLRLTRNPSIPCVLVECGYLSNRAEAARVGNPRFRQQLAESMARAIAQQAAIGDAGTGPLPPPLNEPPSRATDRRE